MLHQSSLFNGKTLANQEAEKSYLIETIEDHTRGKITRTICLYTFDYLNKVNFHKYFDNHENIVLLVRLKSGVIVAGYSEGAFYPKVISDRDGLLMTLTYQNAFELKTPNKRAITYDDYYIIFGNSEVRIKAGEAKLFTNFGISNSFYDHRGVKVNGFIGEGDEREVATATYEIYELEFEDMA